MNWKFKAQLGIGIIILIIIAWVGFTTINFLQFTEKGEELCEGSFLAPAKIGCNAVKGCSDKSDCKIVYSNCYCAVVNKKFSKDLEFLDANIFCFFSACKAQENKVNCINGICVG